MSDPTQNADTDEDRSRELRSYRIGIALAVLLTAAAFAIVLFRLLSAGSALYAIFALGLVQIGVHFRFFLHIDLRRSARSDLQLILFSALIILMMVGGTIVLMFNLRSRMM